ncbi:sulfatase-like hydrolase/transferase [Pseudoflavitalea rhizosphaerae]|uniref:sulfatase-like hydrolase/transferase n=1 Tax=Pseudoflavitalea rhizosphaerae TaxID=1884793 RepID=UPI000F8E17A7|nr:sulfatase-like hydrolase/transferase [Pseudoflavitalea rhizosphaerae]
MKENISTKPYFIFLLPLFYVLHGYLEFIGFASFSTLLPLLLTYFGCIILLWLLLIFIFRNKIKAALMCMAVAGFYLFFGAIFDFLKAYSPWPFLYKYSVLLIAGLTVMICIFIFLHKTSSALKRPVLFLNLLLLIFVLVDLGQALFNANRTTKQIWKGAPNQANGIIPDTVNKPDIYLLVFDGYSSSFGLKQVFGFDNSSFDSSLANRQFSLIPHSRSNYSTTSFSMASTLNMDYLYWLDASKWIKKKDYALSTTQLYDNKVMGFLVNNGYEIVNHSIFDIKGHPSIVNNEWRSIYSNIISEGTLGMRLVIQFRWWLTGTPVINKLLPFFAFENQELNNRNSLDNVMKESERQRKKPRFVYGHFLMPHYPYYRTKTGFHRPPDEFDDEAWFAGPDNYYTEYLQYTNQEILKLIDTIKKNTKEQAVIILMSDHGYHYDAPADKKKYVWNNLNAWYLPEGKPVQLHDNITSVNQFRILFNSLFHQQYPMMKDSLIRIYH